MARRAPRSRTLRELRAEAEAVEARASESRPSARRPTSEEPKLRDKPLAQPRMRLVWGVCDVGGRVVAKFPYAEKGAAESRIALLKSRGKGEHFLRSIKEPIEPED